MRARFQLHSLFSIAALLGVTALGACSDDNNGTPDAKVNTPDAKVIDAGVSAIDAPPSTIDGGALPDSVLSTTDAGPSSPDAGPTADAPPPTLNVPPTFIGEGSLNETSYDGDTDDLLTAGLGKTGLGSANPPTTNAPASNPTAAQLRRLAIYRNYQALVDIAPNGGYGRFWGPNVDLDGNDTLGEGKIAGTETIAYVDSGNGTQNVTVMVQVPVGFDPVNPCIVTATSSGSRGVYGAVSAAGEWGLKRHCAVAYTDKGTGNGAHELMTDTVTLIDGTITNSTAAATESLFTANVTAEQREAFNTATPWRYAFKHAHSQQNPEKDWGTNTLQAVQFAYFVLNEKFGDAITGGHAVRYAKGAIKTIAASVSNGAGASLAAGELDDATNGWITAIVVGEPQINMNLTGATELDIVQGNASVTAFGHPLYDYTTTANLLQPCAAYADSAGAMGAPLKTIVVPMATAMARCASLKDGGYVTGDDFQAQANDALNKLHQVGYLVQSDYLHASMWALAVPPVAVTYANAYSKSSVLDNLCGFSFGTTGPAPAGMAGVMPTVSPMLTIFGNGNGVPPTNGINLVYNNGTSGAAVHTAATADASYIGAKCIRDLWDGNDALAMRTKAGVDAVRYTANLHGKPAIVVQGRSDTLIPINHASRAYFGLNKTAEGNASNLIFFEVENAQHFDAFIDSPNAPGFDSLFIPLHYYNIQALNLMWDHLKNGTALPPSQVVRTTPRGGTPGAAPALDVQTNLRSIKTAPGEDEITFSSNTVTVPN